MKKLLRWPNSYKEWFTCILEFWNCDPYALLALGTPKIFFINICNNIALDERHVCDSACFIIQASRRSQWDSHLLGNNNEGCSKFIHIYNTHPDYIWSCFEEFTSFKTWETLPQWKCCLCTRYSSTDTFLRAVIKLSDCRTYNNEMPLNNYIFRNNVLSFIEE